MNLPRRHLVSLLVAIAGCDRVFGLERDPDASVPIPAWARAIEGERWQIPCLVPGPPDLCTCNDLASAPIQLAGPTGSFKLGVHIRGVYENAHYLNFTASGSGGWIEGGSTAISDVNANRIWIEVSDPPKNYFLNSLSTDPADLLVFDARGELSVTGTASVTFRYDAGTDATERRKTLDGNDVDLPPHPHFDGQFAELVVESVTP